MRTSAPARCAASECRIASWVEVAPVCATTGTRPAVWSMTNSTMLWRSSADIVANSAVDVAGGAAVDRAVDDLAEQCPVDVLLGVEGGGQSGEDTAEVLGHAVSCGFEAVECRGGSSSFGC